jgi:hypothetical protein
MREPKPFFRKQTGTWYVQIGKKQHNLGRDEQVAKQKYHALMAGRQPVMPHVTIRNPASPPRGRGPVMVFVSA